jgi:hypothetical protein
VPLAEDSHALSSSTRLTFCQVDEFHWLRRVPDFIVTVCAVVNPLT